MKKNKKKKEPFVDDGRVISSMNVDGMPWYAGTSSIKENKEITKETPPLNDLTFKEKMAMIKGVLQATLLVGAIFGGAFFLFILFCLFIWLK